jgi:hypothetical protein
MEVLDRMGDFGNYLDTNRAAGVFRPTTDSYRIDETYRKVKGQWKSISLRSRGGDSNLLRRACFFVCELRNNEGQGSFFFLTKNFRNDKN